MRGVIWFVGWGLIGLWSLIAWGSYAAFSAITGLLNTVGTGSVDGFQNEPLSFPALVELLHGLGFAMIGIVWAGISLLIIGLTLLFARLIGGSSPEPRSQRP